MQFDNSFVLNVDGSLCALPGEGKIQTAYLRGFKELVRKLGGEPRKLLEDNGVDPLCFENPDYFIDGIAMAGLLEYCSTCLDDPLFGLHLAEEQYADALGCAAMLARAASSLRQGVQCLIDYVPVSISPSCALEMVVGREVAELRWRTDSGSGDFEQGNYHGLLLFGKALQMLGRQHFRPRYATLTFGLGRPRLQALEDRLGCKIKGRSQASAIAFPADILDLPIATSNKLLFNLLQSYLVQLRTASRSSIIEQVEACVRAALPTGHVSVDDCAVKLGISSRTLQRRLTQLGVKFSDVAQNERIKLAKHALLWSNCTLDEIAFRLGYAEHASFGRAFKQATGMTPRAFRVAEKRKHLEGPGAEPGSVLNAESPGQPPAAGHGGWPVQMPSCPQ